MRKKVTIDTSDIIEDIIDNPESQIIDYLKKHKIIVTASISNLLNITDKRSNYILMKMRERGTIDYTLKHVKLKGTLQHRLMRVWSLK